MGDYFNIIHTVGAYDPWEHRYASYVINTVIAFSAVLIIIGLVIDFITKLLAEKEIEATQLITALKQAQSTAKFGSWEWDVASDMVTWSDELYKIFGLKPNDNPSNYETFLKRIHPEDRTLVNSTVKKSIKIASNYSFEHRIIKPDGTVRYLQGNGQPVLDKNGNIVKLIGTTQDITDAKLLDEARSEFVSLSSHQLRTPATAVKQYLSLLLEGYAGDLSDEQASFLRIAYESNDRQLTIVDDLLSIAQIDSGNIKIRPAEVDLVSMLEQIVKEQALKFENKNQIISFDTKQKKLICNVDERRLRMAIENIIDNAHKYTPNKGKVKLRLTKNHKNIYIYITDNGIGMPKKDIPKIFKKFVRIENSEIMEQSGTGLGLYLSKKIIDLHGGKIKVDSTLNRGSKFQITLPIKLVPSA